MTEKHINPILKSVLELGPIILFFIAYSRIKDQDFLFFGESYKGFIVATALFIPLLLLSTGLLWWLTGKLSKMQLFTAVLVVVFGGLGIWFNDERFFKMKPTMIYLLFAGILGVGLLRSQSYLKSAMEGAFQLKDEGWMILTKRMTIFFVLLAITNELVWRNMSTDAWVNFKTFGLTPILVIFMITQISLFSRYKIEEDTL